jgi:hypothetical protein
VSSWSTQATCEWARSGWAGFLFPRRRRAPVPLAGFQVVAVGKGCKEGGSRAPGYLYWLRNETLFKLGGGSFCNCNRKVWVVPKRMKKRGTLLPLLVGKYNMKRVHAASRPSPLLHLQYSRTNRH